MKEEDFVEHLFIATAHDYILFFTTKGKVYWLKVYNIPSASRLSRGKAIVNLLHISGEEKIAAMICVREFSKDRCLVMATKKGVVKKTNLNAYSNPRKAGIIAINIDEDDKLIDVGLVSSGDDVLLITNEGLSIRFKEKEARAMGRVARGVKGITLNKGDFVVDMEIIKNEEDTLLIVTENGYGKRTPFKQYRVQGRGGKGIITIKTTVRNGKVVSGKRITDQDDIMLITTSGKMVRTPGKGISIVGRNTQGVRVISLSDDDKLSSIAKIVKEESEEVEAENSEEERATLGSENKE
jgi:DNA gyrase subunit A